MIKAKGIYVWSILGMIATLLVVGACKYSFNRFSAHDKAQFEFTVWADTLEDSSPVGNSYSAGLR